MSCANATELYVAMHIAIRNETWQRQTADPESCQTALTYEARPGCTFELRYPEYNFQICVPTDIQWAIANTMHFFAGTEEAEMLCHYNKHASRFVTDDKWIGAYGYIAMPQVRECIKRLREYPQSRRAIVSMGEHLPQDLHRPACWSFLQFLQCRSGLCLLVYQRSLNLQKVMPYDLVVLSNLLLYVARETELPVGSLLWTVGSLHVLEIQELNMAGPRHSSIVLKTKPENCLEALCNQEQYKEDWKCVSYK